jgi:hypothetical protein
MEDLKYFCLSSLVQTKEFNTLLQQTRITDFSTTNYLNEIEKCQYFFFRSKFEVFNIELPSENDFAINYPKTPLLSYNKNSKHKLSEISLFQL